MVQYNTMLALTYLSDIHTHICSYSYTHTHTQLHFVFMGTDLLKSRLQHYAKDMSKLYTDTTLLEGSRQGLPTGVSKGLLEGSRQGLPTGVSKGLLEGASVEKGVDMSVNSSVNGTVNSSLIPTETDMLERIQTQVHFLPSTTKTG